MTTSNIDTSGSKSQALTDLPLFLGYVSSAFLQGILVLQVFVYLFAFKNDRRYIKIVVWFVFSLEWAFTIVTTILATQTLVSTGRLFDLINHSLSKLLPFICALVTLVVQVFYGYRIYLLSGRCLLPIVITLLSIAQCVLLNAAGFNQAFEGLFELFMDHSHEGLETPRAPIMVPTWLCLAAAGDCLIAVALFILLRRASRLLCTRSRTRLARITIICAEAGVITVLAALAELVFYVVFRKKFTHIIVFFMLSKLYSNGMMATLNVRLFMPSGIYEGHIYWEEEQVVTRERDSEEMGVDIIGAARPGSRTTV
ncbi:hypothetical protein PM082_017028 [Marasmius tenuissimus]|nr:hypothetical protein PM082_017028 [Marasmius tenuissimus]